jgi:hypothetical protein
MPRKTTFVHEPWEAELDDKLEELFKDFPRWADHAMSAFELMDKIREFQDLWLRFQPWPLFRVR